MNHSIFTKKEYAHLLNMIPEELYQEIAANEEKKTPEEIKKDIDKLKEKTDTWKEELGSKEKNIVNELNEPNKIQELNTDLQKAQGKVEELSEEKKQTIETLDKLLETSPKLEETTVIKVDVSEKNANLKEGQSGHEIGYLAGSLKSEEREKDYLELSVPEGEHVINIGTSEALNNVLLKRDTSFLITERSKVISKKGDWVTKLTGWFLPKYTDSKKWAENLETKAHEQYEAIRYYTGELGYQSINHYLRSNQTKLLSKEELKKELRQKGKSENVIKEELTQIEKRLSKPGIDNTIHEIDAAMRRFSLKEDITVYRNTGEQELNKKENYFLQNILRLDFKPLENLKTYEEYITKAIEIVEANIGKTNTALGYTSTATQKNTVFKERPIRLEIQVPKGTSAPYIDTISQFPNEKEVLLPRESKFQITGASTVQEQGHNVLVIKAKLINS
ncbi:MAG: ADP-ribosyltransferase [Bacillota bacterium]